VFDLGATIGLAVTAAVLVGIAIPIFQRRDVGSGLFSWGRHAGPPVRVASRNLLLRRPFVITTYGIVRGFLGLDPADVPPGEERYAATLDGADRYGRPLSLAELAAGGVFGLLVTGSAAVSVTGVRFGKGHGYFDLEWAMLSELGLIDGRTEVVAVVHDCQVVEEPLPAQPHDVVVDRIVTPTRTVDVDHPPRAPGRIRWDALKGGELKDLGMVAELEALLRPDPT